MKQLKGKELTDKRVQCNKEILRRLSEYLAAYPDMRFSQALINLDINLTRLVDTKRFGESNYVIDDYYTEPEEVLKRMK